MIKSLEEIERGLKAAVAEIVKREHRIAKLPNDVRCTACEGTGSLFVDDRMLPSHGTYNPCMLCVGTGLTPISSAEVIKGRGTL